MMSGITTRYALGGTHPLVGRLSANFALHLDEGETRLFSLMSRGHAVVVDAGSGPRRTSPPPGAARPNRACARRTFTLRPPGRLHRLGGRRRQCRRPGGWRSRSGSKHQNQKRFGNESHVNFRKPVCHFSFYSWRGLFIGLTFYLLCRIVMAAV